MAAFRDCVQRMKGRLEVKSSKLGTTWLIRFPSPVGRVSRALGMAVVPTKSSRPSAVFS
jgi:hypothetical protein